MRADGSVLLHTTLPTLDDFHDWTCLAQQLKDAYPEDAKGKKFLFCGAHEIPETAVPCAIPKAKSVSVDNLELDLALLPGIRQEKPADLMQGDETRIAGFLVKEPQFDGILCQPGMRTSWAHISAEEVVSFRSFLTGELLDFLDQAEDTGFDEAALQAGLDDIMSRPAELSAALFTLRAEATLQGLSPDVTRARLMAVLIGAELSAARPYWLGQEVVIMGNADSDLIRAYEIALKAQGAMLRVVDADSALLAGMQKSYLQLTQSDDSA